MTANREYPLDAAYRDLERTVRDRVKLGTTTKLSGTLNASPSKSYTHRAIMVGGLGQDSIIENPLVCADTVATARIWRQLGAEMKYDTASGIMRVRGTDGRVCLEDNEINVGEAGTLLRLALPGIAQCSHPVTVDGEGTIRSRPNSSVVRPLRELGADIQGEGSDDCVPLQVNGKGPIRCGTIRLDGKTSSQAISAFLIWAPTFTSGGGETSSLIIVEGDIVSRPYIEITLDVLEWAGLRVEHEDLIGFEIPAGQTADTKGKSFRVGGDYSSAAFILAAAALVESNVTLKGLHPDRQGDRAILDILRRMGVDIKDTGCTITVKGPADLKGIEIDCKDTPDLVPVLTALACFADGRSRFFNIGHLKIKESNRLSAPAEELRKLGASITIGDSEIVIEPSKLRPGTVHSHGDHRLAMALMVAGLRLPGLVVEGVKSIMKSYPAFIRDMRTLGAEIVNR